MRGAVSRKEASTQRGSTLQKFLRVDIEFLRERISHTGRPLSDWMRRASQRNRAAQLGQWPNRVFGAIGRDLNAENSAHLQRRDTSQRRSFLPYDLQRP